MGLLARVTAAFSVMRGDAAEVPQNQNSGADRQEAEEVGSAVFTNKSYALHVAGVDCIVVTGNQVQAEAIKLELD